MTLDFLGEEREINQGHQKKGHKFELCQLTPDKVKADDIYDTNPDFVKGVIKIQTNTEDELTIYEEKACESLLKVHCPRAESTTGDIAHDADEDGEHCPEPQDYRSLWNSS